MLNLDAFEERAAIIEFCGGQSRFAAETAAAAEQGFKRHEALNAIRDGHTSQARDNRSPATGRAADDVPAMQPAPQEADGPLPSRWVQK